MIFYASGNPKRTRDAPELILKAPAVMMTTWELLRPEGRKQLQRRFADHVEKRAKG
jgi:hypothetical protein